MRRRHLIGSLAALIFVLPTLGMSGAACAGEQKSKAGGVGYIHLNTLTATIIRPDGRRGVLTIESGIDTADAAMREQVLKLVPRLRDAYTSTLMIFGGNMRPGDAPDLDQLEAKLQADTNRIVGRPGARILLGTTLVN